MPRPLLLAALLLGCSSSSSSPEPLGCSTGCPGELTAVCFRELCCVPSTSAICAPSDCGERDDGCGGSVSCGRCHLIFDAGLPPEEGGRE